MIYSPTVIPDSFPTALSVDILISTIKASIRRLMAIDNFNNLEDLESIISGIRSLHDEINRPLGLKHFTDKFKESGNVKDEDIKNYLFSIVTPKKLQMLRNWLTCDENIKADSKYKVEVILHIYVDSESNREMYAEQLLDINNEQGRCNVTLEQAITVIQKSVKSFSGREKEYIMPEVVISLLELLKREIFNSNSTRLFTHEAANSDNKVKDYLFSALSAEKLKALKIWLNENEKIIILKEHELGIITSIYVPDFP